MSIIQINPVTLEGKKFLPPQIDVTSNFVDFTSSEFIDSDSQSYSVSSQEIRGNLNEFSKKSHSSRSVGG